MAGNPGYCKFEYSKFTEKRELGKGEFGVVYSAAYSHNFKRVAIRIISRGYGACRPEDTEALTREAGTLFSIEAENVLRMLGVVIEPEHLCLVFEYARYGSLDKVLQRVNKEMELSLRIRIAHDIVKGMCILHQKQIVHARLKCSCIFITEGMHGKIGDVCMGGNREITSWTTVGRSFSRALMQPNSRTNSVAYQPPECILDINKRADRNGDVYAYGVILWELFTGKIAYGGMSADQLYNNVCDGLTPDTSLLPGKFRQLVDKCWHSRSENRPSFEQIEKELKPAVLKHDEEVNQAARKCQELLDEFDPDNRKILAAPVSDMAEYRQTSRNHHSLPAFGDGIATSVSHNDAKASYTPSLENKSGRRDQGGAASTSTEDTIQNVPAEKTSRIVKPDDFYIVAEHLGARRWRRFGSNLGFSEGQLDNIDANYSRSGFPEIPYQMLREWKEGANAPVTVAYLVKILKEQNFHDVAQKLAP